MIYQPMLELLQNLLKHGYNTFFVSGGGVDLLSAWVEEVYGIPLHQVVGSVALKLRAPLGKDIFIPSHKVSFYGGRLCGE